MLVEKITISQTAAFVISFSPSAAFSCESLLFFVGAGAVHATEGYFVSVDDFAVASLVDLAAAVSANVEAWFNGDGDEVGEAFEQARANFSSLLGEFEDFLFFLAHRLDRVFH